MSITSTHDPPTTTRSLEELIIADANLKARPPVTERFVTIQQSQRQRRNFRVGYTPPLCPWMKLAGRWIKHAGFTPGQRVSINVEHGRLIIIAE